jgi:hypothetical protein
VLDNGGDAWLVICAHGSRLQPNEPEQCDGRFVVTGLVGDFFDTKFGAGEIRHGARGLQDIGAKCRVADVFGGFVQACREFGEFRIRQM